MVRSPAVPLTFVAGSANDVFSPELAATVEGELRKRFAMPEPDPADPYQSDEVDGRGWGDLPEGTAYEYPVPYQEMQSRQRPSYNLGGGFGSSAGKSTYGF